MNIFYLHSDPALAAEMHCDKHVVKMILEYAQMLSTAHRVLDGDSHANQCGMYKTSHKNHPSTIWTRTSERNYYWLWDLFNGCLKEYTNRYGKVHSTERLRKVLATPPFNIAPEAFFTDPPQCMPDQYKSTSTITAYRKYYVNEKSHFAKWKMGNIPDWYTEFMM